jgi:hypothetical protein
MKKDERFYGYRVQNRRKLKFEDKGLKVLLFKMPKVSKPSKF